MERTKHIILKWNEMPFFHECAPDTIYQHVRILKRFSKDVNEQYVWWGKVSVSGYLGEIDKHIAEINEEAKKGETYLYMYCPDSPQPTMHVGKLCEISCDNQVLDKHTSEYYREVAKEYNIPYWFKLSDIIKIPLYPTLAILVTEVGKPFDPVKVNYYPMVVYQKKIHQYFKSDDMYEFLLGGYEMKCFKTGNECSCTINYNPKQVFIGCPFKPAFLNTVAFAIKPVLMECGWSVWIASDVVSNIDIMCKVCQAIQASGRAIIDITGWNPNVLLELGLLYGNDKNVLILKQKGEKSPIDLSGIEYLEYDPDDFAKLQRRLKEYF